MINKKILFNIYISILSICILFLITLFLLGNKTRIGYLSEFKINVNKSLELNNFNKKEIIDLFTIDNELNYDEIANYILTNEVITNYSYDFRIKYYSKVFRNNDIYNVYTDINKFLEENSSIKEMKMNDNNGTPFGNLVSDKQFKYDEKIENINYTLKVKIDFLYTIILIIIICIIVGLLYFKSNIIYSKLIIVFCILSIFLLNIPTLKTKQAEIKYITLKDTIIINDNTKEVVQYNDEKLIDYNINDNLITNYNYSATIEYDENNLVNKIFFVSYDIERVFREYANIKEFKISEEYDKLSSFTSDSPINSQEKYFIYYNLIVNKLIIYSILFILLLIYFKYIYIKYLKEKICNHIIVEDNNKKDFYPLIILLTTIFIFIFHYWLVVPGYFQISDVFVSMNDAYTGKMGNYHPVIVALFLRLLYKLFGYHSYYTLLSNLILFYTGIFFISTAIYVKYKNKFSILLLLLSFLANLFYANILHDKDIMATSFVFASYSMLFFTIYYNKNNKISKTIFIISIIFIILGTLWRHNFIVTTYPIFIYIIHKLILKNITTKKYIFYFINYMLMIAILMIIVVKSFPLIVIDNNMENKGWEYSANHLFLLQIAACSTLSDDDSLIHKEWYSYNKNFEDLKNAYNDNKLNADNIGAPWAIDRPFKGWVKYNNLKSVWLKYIIKYPNHFINHIFGFVKAFLDISEKNIKYNSKSIQYKDDPKWINQDFYNSLDYKSITFNKTKESIYNFLYKVLPGLKTLYFAIFNLIIFFISLILILIRYKNNTINTDSSNLLIFIFSVSFSSLATAIIVILFTPIVTYRYIYPIMPISILSLISFITFIYDISGFKILSNKLEFIKLLGKKK